ncbi:MAG TPA: hypothetical protein VJ350_08345 [Methanoregula sp.]|nr:hypothetical protein [Methanoregula sp.]
MVRAQARGDTHDRASMAYPGQQVVMVQDPSHYRFSDEYMVNLVFVEKR